MVMDLVSADASETARSASRIKRLARSFIWVIPFRGWKVCDDGLNDEARWGTEGPFLGAGQTATIRLFCTDRVGTGEFQRVMRLQPGDLVVWRGHVGILVNPEQHLFLQCHAFGARDRYL